MAAAAPHHHLQASRQQLAAGSPELALLQAKRAVDAAPLEGRCWAAMAKALAAMQDLETAYSVAAKGLRQCRAGEPLSPQLLESASD